MTQIDVAVCTYRRESVAETLTSILESDLPGSHRVWIIVIDNDDTPSAEARVAAIAKTARWPIEYRHKPAGNISIACNEALDAATGRYLAFVDDDETVSRGWLAALLQAIGDAQADVVLGPVRADYDPSAPNWMQLAEVHATRPVWVNGKINSGYTCNVMIDRLRPAIAGVRFDPALGQSGGEDTAYFSLVHARGGRFTYAPTALVMEPVSRERASFCWLARRKFRMGQTHAHVLRQNPTRSLAADIVLALGKAGVYAGVAVATLPIRHLRNRATLRCALHLGVVAGLTGRETLRLYGSTRSDAAP